MPSTQTYKGLFVLLALHIEEVARKIGIVGSVTLSVTPLDEKNNEITARPILASFPGIPMHSDIVYSREFEHGEVQTNFRLFARELIKLVDRYMEDPNPSSPFWEGPDLKAIAFPEI